MVKIAHQVRFQKQSKAGRDRILVALGLLLLLTAATARAQDASTQDQAIVNAAREKGGHKAKIVVTDDDMPSHPQPVETQASTGDPDNHDRDEGKQKRPEPQAHTPRQIAAPKNLTPEQAQALLDKLKGQEQSLIRQYDEIQDKLNNTTDELVRNVYSDMLSKRDEVLAQKRKEIESAERGLQAGNEVRKSQGETRDATK